MKRMSTIAAALAATSLVAAPAMAAPTNAASSLSVVKARAAAPTAKGEKIAGGGAIFGILIAAGVAAIAIIAAVQNDDSDSN